MLTKKEEWITEGIVTVNGEIARLGIRVDPERDLIRVRGKKITTSTSRSDYLYGQ